MTLKPLAFALLLAPTLAAAQTYDSTMMRDGLTALETEVSNAFAFYEIDADVRTLDLSQIVEISDIIDDEDNSSPADVRSAIEVALTRE